MASASETSPSCPCEAGSVCHIVGPWQNWGRSSLHLLLERLAGQLTSAHVWWNVCVGRSQPKERVCILPGDLLHHDIGSAHTETSSSFGLQEANRRGVVGCPASCPPTPAHPNTPSGITLARAQNQTTGRPKRTWVQLFKVMNQTALLTWYLLQFIFNRDTKIIKCIF